MQLFGLKRSKNEEREREKKTPNNKTNNRDFERFVELDAAVCSPHLGNGAVCERGQDRERERESFGNRINRLDRVQQKFEAVARGRF